MLTKTLSQNTASTDLDSLRNRLTQILLVFIIVISIGLTFVQPASASGFGGVAQIVNPLVALVASVMLVLLRDDRLTWLIRSIPPLWLALISYTVYGDDVTLIVTMSLATVSSALITNRRMYIFINGLIVARLLLHAYITMQTGAPTISELQVVIFGVLAVGNVPIVLGILIRYVLSTLESTVEESQQSANLLRASALIGQNMSEMLNLDALLPRAVDIIKERFGYYHVQIFTVDENQRYANLTASTGDVGAQMLARQHRLAVNAESIVGRAVLSGDTIVTQDTRQDEQHSFNELLPDTRAEMALPLHDGDNVIGVLDVQADGANAFDDMEIQALQVITSQLATAIRNARLFESQERNLRENKRLFIESETNLREIQRLNRQMTRQTWEDYLQTDRRINGVTLSGQRFDNSAQWTDLMRDAGRKRRPMIKDDENGNRRIAIPLELRGEVVGVVEIETTNQDTKDDIIDMVQAISQRLAVSLDNARLFEETNEASAQEQRVSELVSEYQSADSVDDLLQITLRGLADTLGAEEGAIRLGSISGNVDDADPPSQNGVTAPNHTQLNGGAS